jgi:hypothetical protein
MTFQCLIWADYTDGTRSAHLSFLSDDDRQLDIPINLKDARAFIRVSKLKGHKDIDGIHTFYGFDPMERTATQRYHH